MRLVVIGEPGSQALAGSRSCRLIVSILRVIPPGTNLTGQPVSMRESQHIRMTMVAGIASLLVSAAARSQTIQLSALPDLMEGGVPVLLSAEHLQAVRRSRRIIDYPGFVVPYYVGTPTEWIEYQFSLIDQPGVQVESILWCLDEGNVAYHPSKVLPVHHEESMDPWYDAGVDAYQVMVDETHRRGLEALFAYRINGFDRGVDDVPFAQPVKEAHPEWLIPGGWIPTGMWNFAEPGVHEYKTAILREVVEKYDFDGVCLDFARHPPNLPVGHQWEYREGMTQFMRRVRGMLQEVAHTRGRPLLLSARVPATVPGCHYDGLDVETWIRENLIDLIMPGVRAIDVDLEHFRRLTQGTHVRLYPSIDDAHAPDGYQGPYIEFFRGLCASWYRRGADGIVAWNVWDVTPEAAAAAGLGPVHAADNQLFLEVGDPEALRLKDKCFVIPRRYGAGWEDRWDSYQNMNHQAPLPAPLAGGQTATWLELYVADDVAADAAQVESIELRILLSGMTGADSVEAKLNGILLPAPTRGDEWQVFHPRPQQFAVGENLITLRLSDPDRVATIEKVEVHVAYRSPQR